MIDRPVGTFPRSVATSRVAPVAWLTSSSIDGAAVESDGALQAHQLIRLPLHCVLLVQVLTLQEHSASHTSHAARALSLAHQPCSKSTQPRTPAIQPPTGGHAQ